VNAPHRVLAALLGLGVLAGQVGAATAAQAETVPPQSGHMILAQPDGRLLVGADIGNPHATEFSLRRYLPNGSPDPSFADHGLAVTSPVTPGESHIGALTLLPNGEIIAAGSSSQRRPDAYDEPGIALAKYRADGSLDPQFGEGGIARTGYSDPYRELSIDQVGVQPNGGVIVCGSNGVDGLGGWLLERYSAKGNLDGGFGKRAKKALQARDEDCLGMLVQADGKVIVSEGHALARLNQDGSLDTTFGWGGRTQTLSQDSTIDAITRQPNGDLVVKAWGYVGPRYQLILARYTANGIVDTSFGEHGVVVYSAGGIVEKFSGVTVGAEGSLTLVTAPARRDETGTPVTLVRYHANGTLDTSFGNGGSRDSVLPTGSHLNDTTPAPDGGLYLLGTRTVDWSETPFLTHYLANGTLDPTFQG
jgi:uncharacterized delta-60 repeat protein